MSEPNFCIPIPTLETNKLRLDPFEPSIHAQQWTEEIKARPDLVKYLSYGPFTTTSDFLSWYESVVEPDRSTIWLAMMVKSGDFGDEEKFAGVVGLAGVSLSNASAEMAYVLIFPPFQRTFTLTHAVGLLLHYLLDPKPLSLGFRRIEWTAQIDNERSARAAERLGFVYEGTRRWSRALRDEKWGEEVDEGRALVVNGVTNRRGRHDRIYALCWDDWEGGGRERVGGLMRRER